MFGGSGMWCGPVVEQLLPGVTASTDGHRQHGSSNVHTASQSGASFLAAHNHPHLSFTVFFPSPTLSPSSLCPHSPLCCSWKWNGCRSAAIAFHWEADRVKKSIRFNRGGSSAVQCCEPTVIRCSTGDFVVMCVCVTLYDLLCTDIMWSVRVLQSYISWLK